METIKNHFVEAKQILDCFISDPQNFINIEKAGEILVDAIKSGKKVIVGGGDTACFVNKFNTLLFIFLF